eukprot:3126403-Pleurochrysis_carterae.AAC.1
MRTRGAPSAPRSPRARSRSARARETASREFDSQGCVYRAVGARDELRVRTAACAFPRLSRRKRACACVCVRARACACACACACVRARACVRVR